jgi:hypothetical protein
MLHSSYEDKNFHEKLQTRYFEEEINSLWFNRTKGNSGVTLMTGTAGMKFFNDAIIQAYGNSSKTGTL